MSSAGLGLRAQARAVLLAQAVSAMPLRTSLTTKPSIGSSSHCVCFPARRMSTIKSVSMPIVGPVSSAVPARRMSTIKYVNMPIVGPVSSADDGIRLDRLILRYFDVPEDLLRKFIRQKRFRVMQANGQPLLDSHAVGTTKLEAGVIVVTDKEGWETLDKARKGTAQASPPPAGAAITKPVAPTPAPSSSEEPTAAPPVKLNNPKLEMMARNMLRSGQGVLHADEDVVALSKPPGLAAQGGTGVDARFVLLTAAYLPSPSSTVLHHRLPAFQSAALRTSYPIWPACSLPPAAAGLHHRLVHPVSASSTG